MTSKINMKKSDAQSINIQSYIRVRPLASKEKKASVLEFGKKEVIIKSAAESSKLHKTLIYDRVFDEESKQIVVYNSIVKPMIKEVLQGYNCTVFAYGQTGTGKTYTMTGDQDSQSSWEENIHAGIVPRAMQDLFAELSILSCEYQVSVSYMELYNEKLRSLLKDSDDTDIKLIDDLEGGVIVKGLLPTPVKGKEEAFRLLQQGADKRQVAATQMNTNSSRSHTIFTINVNIKENVVAGKDDVLRCGKLHLVDLAGSENVSKSGASETIHKTATGLNKRLAEASNINKSLLTLGRVITCLTENNPHIPYRESKLTRFLQDSLGGKTKTCIIGTISPAQSNLDETESTLNYAYKARSIKNKPVKNQTISKKDFMMVASEEIMKLKKDLEAVRQGEGFYISKESHEEMIIRMKELDDQVKDWHEKYSRIKESYEQTKEMFSSLSSDFDDKCAEYEELDNLFRIECQKCQDKMTEFAKEIVVREYFIAEYEKTEDRLTEQAKTCKSVLENIIEQSNRLHDKIDRKQSNESKNIQTLLGYKENVSKKVADFQSKLDTFFNEEKLFVKEVNKYAGTLSDVMHEEKEKIVAYVSSFEQQMNAIAQSSVEKLMNMQNEFTDEVVTCKALGEETIKHSISLYRDFIQSHIVPSMKNIQDQLSLVTKAAEEGRDHLSTYEARQAELISKITENHEALTESVRKTMSEVDAIRQQNLRVSVSAGSIHNHADRASQKITEVLKMMKVLMTAQADIDSINSESSSVVEDATAAAERAEALGSAVRSDMEQYGSNQSELIQAVDKVSQDRTDYQETLTSQIGEDISGLLAEGDSQLKHVESSVDEHIHQMQTLNNEERENLSKLECSANKFTDYLTQTTQTYGGEVKQFVGEMKTKLNKKDHSLEKVLRKQSIVTHQKLQQMNENELAQVIQELDRDLRTISYAEYVPLGSTPQRICKDKLTYPRKFDSTAPRQELVKRLREKYPETESVPNDSLNVKKHLPAGPFFNGEIQVSTESSPSSVRSAGTTTEGRINFDAECTPQARANALRRRSTSMPDLKNLLDDVFVVPSPFENKENNINRSARKTVKTKIPDVVKTKKKTVLSSVQVMNNSAH